MALIGVAAGGVATVCGTLGGGFTTMFVVERFPLMEICTALATALRLDVMYAHALVDWLALATVTTALAAASLGVLGALLGTTSLLATAARPTGIEPPERARSYLLATAALALSLPPGAAAVSLIHWGLR